MGKYHKYVFDIENREFVGKFEEMYQNETKEIFDSWHQDDSRQVQRKVCFALLEQFNFQNIIDLGCGKGSVTHQLKKLNNQVLGIDISETAVKFAKERYPDIKFLTANINDTQVLSDILKQTSATQQIDLVFCMEVLSYLENWDTILKHLSKYTEYIMICIDIPDNPIGFVKSGNQLRKHVEAWFHIQEHIHFDIGGFHIIIAQSKEIQHLKSIYIR